ncbi:response regulator [Aminobacter sp. MET-1]|uniref:response regulator n=1 Tax=Aminobacter sp. MET-1 TaxID=2951085 RepID=UPI00226A7AFC|nr:response regulator [Aminobacter sp. MET-1]MCX8570786.1 response regulator [Aminobacter sp. MET-1]
MSNSLSSLRILVVEDEMLVAMSIEDALVEAGHEVIGPAARVEQALSHLGSGQPIDAVVLDMNLHGFSGVPVAEEATHASIPVLILSGHGENALNGLSAATPHMSKPFDSPTLVAAVEDLVNRTNRQRKGVT